MCVVVDERGEEGVPFRSCREKIHFTLPPSNQMVVELCGVVIIIVISVVAVNVALSVGIVNDVVKEGSCLFLLPLLGTLHSYLHRFLLLLLLTAG